MGPNGVNHISMYFRDHCHVTKQNYIKKLENRILEKSMLLYERCVNWYDDFCPDVDKKSS